MLMVGGTRHGQQCPYEFEGTTIRLPAMRSSPARVGMVRAADHDVDANTESYRIRRWHMPDGEIIEVLVLQGLDKEAATARLREIVPGYFFA